MRFRYSFEKIVELKTNEKTQAEWMLSKAIGKLREEESSLEQLQDQKNSLYHTLLDSSTKRTTISQIMLIQDYLEHLGQQISVKHQEVRCAEAVVSNQRDSLTEKMIEEKVWTKSREKAYDKFTLELRKKEQEELDDITTTRRVKP